MTDDTTEQAFISLVNQGTQMLSPTVEKAIVESFGSKERAIKMVNLFTDRYRMQWNISNGGLLDFLSAPTGFTITDRWGKN